jgi:hypothetical protein
MTTNPFAPSALLSGEPGTILGHRVKRTLEPWEHLEVSEFIDFGRGLYSTPSGRPMISDDRIREICGWFELSEPEIAIVFEIIRAKQQQK